MRSQLDLERRGICIKPVRDVHSPVLPSAICHERRISATGIEMSTESGSGGCFGVPRAMTYRPQRAIDRIAARLRCAGKSTSIEPS